MRIVSTWLKTKLPTGAAALGILLLGLAPWTAQSAPTIGEWAEITPPPALRGQSLCYDAVGHRLLMFGGFRAYDGRSGPLPELWAFAPESGWQRLPGLAVQSVVYANLLIDTRRHRLVTFGNTAEECCLDYSELATYALDGTSDWVAQAGGSMGYTGVVAVYDSLSDRIIGFNRDGRFGPSDNLTRSFRFDGSGWQDVPTTGPSPPLLFGRCLAHQDIARRRMLVTDRLTGGVWTLDLSSMEWEQFPDSLPPGTSTPVAIAFDQPSQRLLAVAGDGKLFQRGAEHGARWALAAAPAAPPTALTTKASAWDPEHARFLFHGNVPAEVWALETSPTAHWSLLAPASPEAPMGTGHPMCFDTRRNRLLMGEGASTYWTNSCVNFPSSVIAELYAGRLWSLELAAPNPVWRQVSLSRPVLHGPYGTMVYDSRRDRTITWGGAATFRSCNGSSVEQTTYMLEEALVTDLSTAAEPTFLDTSGVPYPRGRRLHGAVWDQRGDRMIIVGGLQHFDPPSDPPLQDVWQLSGPDLRWSPLVTSGPVPSGATQLLIDAARNRLYAFPALDFPPGTRSTSMHTLDLATNVWTRSDLPAPVWSERARFLMDPTGDRILVAGGDSAPNATGDLWELPLPDANFARRLSYPGDVVLSDLQSALWDGSGQLVLQGGRSPGGSGAGQEMRSTWLLRLAAPTATEADFATLEATAERVRMTLSAPAPGATLGIERRSDDAGWNRLAEVTADGRALAVYEDTEIQPGQQYGYRASWMVGGTRRTTREHSVTIPERAPARLALARLHPSPATDRVTASLEVPGAGPVQLRIIDVMGRAVHAQELHIASAGRLEQTVTLPAGLGSGLYWLDARSGEVRVSRAFLVVR